MPSRCSTVVGYLTTDPEVKGSNPAASKQQRKLKRKKSDVQGPML
jgi:hypothetical protein